MLIVFKTFVISLVTVSEMAIGIFSWREVEAGIWDFQPYLIHGDHFKQA